MVNDVDPVEIQTSIVATAKLVQAELVELHESRCATTRRIRSLHRIIATAMANDVAPVDLQTSIVATAKLVQAELAKLHETRCVIERRIRHLLRVLRAASYIPHTLRRACRIALMEAGEAASAAEVYSRIVRRGSFVFENRRSAVFSIARALRAMTEEGETNAVSGDGSRWELTRRTEVP